MLVSTLSPRDSICSRVPRHSDINSRFPSPSGLPRDHPESYHYYMWNEFFKHVDIEPSNAHVLDGNAADLVAECTRFEDLIREAGGVHLFIGGMWQVQIK